MDDKRIHIILASASARRKQLLAQAGYNFTVVPSDIDESAFAPQGVSPAEYAKKLALAKAKNVAEKFPGHLVIGADTIVDFQGRVIGKPENQNQAEQITRELFSTPHTVITAVAIVKPDEGLEIVETDSTTIYPRKISDEQIARHIKSRSWQNKAGAYAIKENGDEFIDRIDGSLTNVMGLPMELLGRLLAEITD